MSGSNMVVNFQRNLKVWVILRFRSDVFFVILHHFGLTLLKAKLN